jgi:transcriptional regulator with XRE-family HTH domain
MAHDDEGRKRHLDASWTVTLDDLMDAGQCKGARGVLEWSVADLAARSGVSRDTIKRLEAGNDKIQLNNLLAVRDALRAAGITFASDGLGRKHIVFETDKKASI